MVPAGSFAKAESVGAKTVKGPGLFNVSTRFAAVTAVTSVSKLPAPTAVSTMSVGSRVCAIAEDIKMVKKKLKIVFKRTPSLKLSD
jgi:hypothetical protein